MLKTPQVKSHPWYVAKVWLGYNAVAWCRLLLGNGCRVAPRHWATALLTTLVSVCNSLLNAVEQLVWGGKIARTEIKHPPLFILGHWRTGTTLLHELLILDPRHGFPNSYHCTNPGHFLFTEWFAQRFLGFLLPPERPMDNMRLGWEAPQEDEFALGAMGIPTPYWTIGFPNHPPQAQEYFDLERISSAEQSRWKRHFMWFVRRLTLHDARRMVFKSPPHTCRIPTLLELFPDARFVHIVRDPYVVFSSTVHLWRSLYNTQGLQCPNFEGIEEYVFETFSKMYDRLEATRSQVAPERFFELRYEDLVADPLQTMRTLYETLELEGFDEVQPRIAAYFAARSDYKTNKYQISPELREEITRRWGRQIEQYGYEQTSVACDEAGNRAG